MQRNIADGRSWVFSSKDDRTAPAGHRLLPLLRQQLPFVDVVVENRPATYQVVRDHLGMGGLLAWFLYALYGPAWAIMVRMVSTYKAAKNSDKNDKKYSDLRELSLVSSHNSRLPTTLIIM